jgi:hypothetical protein
MAHTRQQHQVVDHLLHPVGATSHRLEEAHRPFVDRETEAVHDLQVAGDHGQRRTRVVGERREELAPVVVELLQLAHQRALPFERASGEEGRAEVVADLERGRLLDARPRGMREVAGQHQQSQALAAGAERYGEGTVQVHGDGMAERLVDQVCREPCGHHLRGVVAHHEDLLRRPQPRSELAGESDHGAGDVVLVRSGWGQHFDSGDKATFMGQETGVPGVPGVSEAGATWLARHDVHAVGADTIAFERLAPGAGHGLLPAHRVLLVERGIYIVETMDLEELARDAIHEFLFVLSPLAFFGATGSPVRPLAVVGA